jgi:transposase
VLKSRLVIRIETEHDIEILRQVARLLDREVQALHQRIQKLVSEIVRLRGGDASALQLELEQLQELLARREQALFGDSSEKRRSSSKDKPAVDGEKPKKKGHGPTAQPNLALVEQLHELPADNQGCPQCGGALRPMNEQFEESEEISVVERQFVLVKHRRLKYRCRCNACVVTAPGPRKLIPGGRYSTEFGLEVAVSKYVDHNPLDRQVRTMGREGLEVSSQTLWDQLNALARHLEPCWIALGERVLKAPVIHADETHWRLMDGKSSRYWVWCVASNEAVFYRICSSRSAVAAGEVLSKYGGIVMADGYGAYSSLEKERHRDGPSFTLAHCWAHVRRKFKEIEQNFPLASAEALDWIGKLYEVERLVVPSKEQDVVLEQRARLRAKRSQPLMDQLRRWAEKQTPLPQSGLGKAISYMWGMWPGLTRFLKDPRIPLDNNAGERALRAVVVGRKNHYGSRSRRGTEVAALFYSLCESAKLVGVEPRSYLLQATYAAIDRPGTVTLPESLIPVQ